MRILVTTTGGTGHILPVAPIAHSLAQAGHQVVWATSRASCPLVERLGFAWRPAGLDPGERTALFMQRHGNVESLPTRSRPPRIFPGLFAEVAGPAMASDLVPVLDELRPDLVVHEVAELAAAPLAAKRGIPNVAVAFSGAIPPEVLEAAVAAAETMWRAVGLRVPRDLGLYHHGYLHPFAKSLGQRPDHVNVRDMRPLSAAAVLRELAALPWLGQLGVDRPLVYATYGTAPIPQDRWHTLMDGLAMLDVDAVVTTGAATEPDELRTRLPQALADHIRIERYVEQAAVLPRAAAVVSHGGAGTMIGAGVAGVPQIALPVGADQFENADAFSAAGVAVTLEGSKVDAAAIADNLGQLLGDTSRQEAAARLADEFRAMPHPDEIAAVLCESGR